MQAILENFLLFLHFFVFPCSWSVVLQIAHGHHMCCPAEATNMVLSVCGPGLFLITDNFTWKDSPQAVRWESRESGCPCSLWAAMSAACTLLLQFLYWMVMQAFQHWVIPEYILSRKLVAVRDNFPQVFTHTAVQLGCLERVKRKAHKHDWVNICFLNLNEWLRGNAPAVCSAAPALLKEFSFPWLLPWAALPGHQLALRATTEGTKLPWWHREITGKIDFCRNLVPK